MIKKPTNISYVVNNHLCIGCGVCEAICPNDAIKIIFNTKCGIPIPIVHEKRCNRCQKCLNICYGYESDNNLNLRIFGAYPISIIGNLIKCYTGHTLDPKLRFSSSSGGAVTALLKYALEKKLIDAAIVTRMEPGNPIRAKAFIAHNVNEIISAQGSKYCPVSFADCLSNIENGKKYAVVGLPCHIYGIRRLAEFNSKIRNCICYYFGLVCGGMPNFFGTLYILKNYNMADRFITKFEYRGGGWPGRLLIRGRQIVLNKESEIRVPYAQYWRDSFAFFFPFRCTVCHDGFNEFSDISFGDAWLPHVVSTDNNGTSLIITRTTKGQQLVNAAFKNKILKIEPIEVKDAISSQPGLLQLKFFSLNARINLSRKLRRKLPLFDLSRKPPAKLGAYLSGLSLYLGRAIAIRKDLWRLFDIYVSANSLFLTMRHYLRKIQKMIRI
jgi:coenzyme F420 hydrogenase subunit beta